MTTQDELIKKKFSLLELAELLKNISEACRINGCSRQREYFLFWVTYRASYNPPGSPSPDMPFINVSLTIFLILIFLKMKSYRTAFVRRSCGQVCSNDHHRAALFDEILDFLSPHTNQHKLFSFRLRSTSIFPYSVNSWDLWPATTRHLSD
jgi:hypothetical protein